MPRISILLPVRNGAATLPEALESTARQGFDDHEVVAVNDASDDATVELLQQYRQRGPRCSRAAFDRIRTRYRAGTRCWNNP